MDRDSTPLGVSHVFFGLCFMASLLVLSPMLVPLGAGAVLGYVCERPVSRLRGRLRVRGPIGQTLLAAGFVLVVSSAFVVPVLLTVYNALRELLALMSEHLGEGRAAALSPTIGRWFQRLGERLTTLGLPISPTDVQELGQRGRAWTVSGAAYVLQALSELLQATPGAIFRGAIVLMTWTLSIVHGRALRERLLPWLIPWAGPREMIGRVTGEILHGLIVANLIVSAVQAVLCTAALGLLAVPRFLLWGVMAFFLSFVPVVGTTIVTLGAAGYLLSVGRYGAAVMMLLVAVIVGSIDNVLRPLFMQGSVQLGFFWIFLSLIGGLAVFGLAGSVLGPLVLCLCVAALRALEEAHPTLTDNAGAAVADGGDHRADRPAGGGSEGAAKGAP